MTVIQLFTCYTILIFAETMYRLCNQCEASLSLYAKEQRFHQVSHMETGRLTAVRIFHYGHDSVKYYSSYDEGKFYSNQLTLY